MTLASGSKRKCFWDTSPVAVFIVTTGKPICNTHVFIIAVTLRGRLPLSAAWTQMIKRYSYSIQKIYDCNLWLQFSGITTWLRKMKRTCLLQMVPQVLVDGISIFKLLQVALITVKAKRYSNTDTHICAHTHTHIHSQILWNSTTVESTLSLF